MVNIQDNINLKEIYRQGARIIDVRTEYEFRAGHLSNSENIPLNKLKSCIHTINTNDAVILCCASGSRSQAAKQLMESRGFTNVHDGGSWLYLKKLTEDI